MVTATFRDPDGNSFERELVRHPGAVAVVPLHDDGTVTLVRQYRPAIEHAILEIPAGVRDVAGEPPSETARRELAEETGLLAGTLEHVVTFYNSPGFCDEETIIYLATDLREGAATPAGNEERWLELEKISLEDLPELTRSQAIMDGQTLLGLHLVRQRLASPA